MHVLSTEAKTFMIGGIIFGIVLTIAVLLVFVVPLVDIEGFRSRAFGLIATGIIWFFVALGILVSWLEESRAYNLRERIEDDQAPCLWSNAP